MRTFYNKLITTGLLISSFIFFCGIGGCVSISGLVTGDVKSGVTLTLTGDAAGSTTTSSDGSYTFAGLSNGTYTITPSLTGYIFTPASQTVTIPDDDTANVDFTIAETGDTGELNTVASINDNMISISGGTFLMGCRPEDTECHSYESPQHSVTISAFKIGRYEITQGQWEAVMESNPSSFPSCGDNCPVNAVSWDDIQEFITELNAQTGLNYRLPTEAEWEYASRAGTTTKWYCGDDESCVNDIAWYDDNSDQAINLVGQKNPNAWGLYDMSGNVSEWVQDWYSYGYYSISPLTDPTGPASGSDRVKRGGSWSHNASYIRSANRNISSSDIRYPNLGFRLSR